jgi:hypothetical protein
MNPVLVEPTIKYILNHQLSNIKGETERRNNLIFNIGLTLVFFGVLYIILRLKYKGQQNIQERIERENRKKHYILSNLRKYQTMKSQPITNIPIN